MKNSRATSERSGFTLVELLVVILLIAVLAAMLLPVRNDRRSALRVHCLSNLKQIAFAGILYADNHENRLPMEPRTGDAPGTREDPHVYPYFQPVLKYILTPDAFDVLVCPLDRDKHAATNAVALSDANISYFLNADAQGTNQPAQTVLAGDRDLRCNGRAVAPGPFLLAPNLAMDWSGVLHPTGGNLAFADGHAEANPLHQLDTLFARQPLATNRLVVP